MQQKKDLGSPSLGCTWAAVFDCDQGGKVLGVIAEHYGILVALSWRPVKRQVNASHIER